MSSRPWRSRYLRVNGRTTHYLEAGDGPVIVLLHGGEYGASAALTWSACMSALAQHHRVIAIDFFGFGGSDKIRDFTGQRRLFITQVAEFLDALRVDSAYFVGTSLSARLLLDVARRENPPWPILGMTVAGLGLLPPAGPDAATLATFDGSDDSLRPILEVLFHRSEFARNEDYLQERLVACREPGAWECAEAAKLRLPGRDAGAKRQRSAPRYDTIAVSSCLIRGEHDRLVPRGDWDALAEALPDARAVQIDDCGHYPQIERAEAFCDAVLSHAATLTHRTQGAEDQ